MRVTLTFDASRMDRARAALADDLRLVLSEFPNWVLPPAQNWANALTFQ